MLNAKSYNKYFVINKSFHEKLSGIYRFFNAEVKYLNLIF